MAHDETNSHTAPQTIVVASHNPVKIDASLQGFARMFPGSRYTARGVGVPSGVSDQPLSDAETLRGAQGRVERARTAEPDADYWVGIEGGVSAPDGAAALQSFAWVVVTSRAGRTGKARTAAYYLAEETARLVRGGLELGRAEDAVFGRTNSKQHNGSVGLLTDDAVDRTAFYVQAVVLALIPFKNTNLTFLADQ
ncbi:hypothetical protein SPI_01171 [Niveomyces insectorum RCEF 264]|uniref:inosine/xanthosine triphosphatase n=1 Tax=Niveomyces insectorum RCEF 264 TaxID=1081102 RepID=A0A167YR36_9HYPO|nr:hypothetical protein SPI_01171 [Niveomyces insectorum RCEF 264]